MYPACSLATAKTKKNGDYTPCKDCTLFVPNGLPKASAWQKVQDLDW